MSFILDALKKSEDRRRLEEAGRKPTHKTLDLGRPGARRWPSWLFVAVLAVALAGGWWLRGASPPPAAEEQAVAPAVSSAPDSHSTPRPVEMVRPSPFAPVPSGTLENDLPATAGSAPDRDSRTASAVLRTNPEASVKAVRTAPPRTARLPAGLPEMTMSLHFYAEDPGRRMVRIGDRIVREGQALTDRLVLEEITPSGAVFSFAGERFELPRPGGQP